MTLGFMQVEVVLKKMRFRIGPVQKFTMRLWAGVGPAERAHRSLQRGEKAARVIK
jgi:hypothetical protein